MPYRVKYIRDICGDWTDNGIPYTDLKRYWITGCDINAAHKELETLKQQYDKADGIVEIEQ